MEQLKFEIFEQEILNPLQGHELSELETYIASLLLEATQQNPIMIAKIIQKVSEQMAVRVSDRRVKAIIRKLRKEPVFPILSSREKPYGYWWCGSEQEMKEFIEHFLAQPFDELQTIWRIVRKRYPALAGQLKFNDVL